MAQLQMKGYPLRSVGVVRTWLFNAGTVAAAAQVGNGAAVTSPTAMYVECYASTFPQTNVQLFYSADNTATPTALATEAITFTAAGVKWLAAADTKTGFFHVLVSDGNSSGVGIVVNLVCLGATDVI